MLKIVSTCGRNSGLVTPDSVDTKETLVTKSIYRCFSTLEMFSDICVTAILKTFLTQEEISQCLCGISTRQLELLLWRAGPTAQHLQYYLIFFIQLNYVYIKIQQNKVPPPYVKLPLPEGST